MLPGFHPGGGGGGDLSPNSYIERYIKPHPFPGAHPTPNKNDCFRMKPWLPCIYIDCTKARTCSEILYQSRK